MGQDIAQVLTELETPMRSWGLKPKNKLCSVTNEVIGHVPFCATKNLMFFKQKDQEQTKLSVVQAKKTVDKVFLEYLFM